MVIILLNIERVDCIWQEIKERKVVHVKNLAEKHYASPSTIRRDLNYLAKEGLIRRTYGGAVLIENSSSEIPFQARVTQNKAEKDIIAELAAQMVPNGCFLLLDSSSTVARLVKNLHGVGDLTVLTTSAQLSLDCLKYLPNTAVYCSGGVMNPYTRSFIGESAHRRIKEFRPDILFFSARAISFDDGITDVNEENTSIIQLMIESARKSVFLCDTSKFDKTSYRVICDIGGIDCIVTNDRPPERWLQHLKSVGVEAVYPNSTKESL